LHRSGPRCSRTQTRTSCRGMSSPSSTTSSTASRVTRLPTLPGPATGATPKETAQRGLKESLQQCGSEVISKQASTKSDYRQPYEAPPSWPIFCKAAACASVFFLSITISVEVHASFFLISHSTHQSERYPDISSPPLRGGAQSEPATAAAQQHQQQQASNRHTRTHT
jgi:hypothetical protein